MTKQILRNLLAEGKMAQVFAELLKLRVTDNELANSILQAAGRFEVLRRQEHAGTLTHEQLSVESNRITAAVLHIVEQLPEDLVRREANTNENERSPNSFVAVNNNQNQNNMTGDSNKAIALTVLIAVFGVAIGFLGELMPDDFKSRIEVWTVAHLGISYLKAWCIVTALVVLAFLYFVWREALHKENEESPTGRTVRQGNKSIYIEKNEGDITIN